MFAQNHYFKLLNNYILILHCGNGGGANQQGFCTFVFQFNLYEPQVIYIFGLIWVMNLTNLTHFFVIVFVVWIIILLTKKKKKYVIITTIHHYQNHQSFILKSLILCVCVCVLFMTFFWFLYLLFIVCCSYLRFDIICVYI